MIKEEKELLIKDLCGRLPYGVKVKVFDNDILRYDTEHGVLYGEENMDNDDFVIKCHNDSWVISCENFKPYLRQMSSMTDEELYEWTHTWIMDTTAEKYDWLNTHNFDYRDLIEKGLALETPEGMYKIE